MTEKKCKICKISFKARANKLFCSIKCKSYYHRQLRKVTHKATEAIDEILHRNRSILLEIMGKNKVQVKVNRLVLEKKKFRFKYHTHYHINKGGKVYHYVYDIAWMSFADDEILMLRS